MSSSSQTSEEEHDGGGDQEVVVQIHLGHGDHPSSSRRRSAEAVWPEHFIEDLAARVGADAARVGGKLAAAPAVCAVFLVCSTWRSVSRSELLWQELTGRVWSRDRRDLPTWRDEYSRLHRTGRSLRLRRSAHSHLHPASPSPCRRLSLSDRHLAAGFLDGSVRLFSLPEGAHLATYFPQPHRDRLGHFSPSISGLILPRINPSRLVFASQDGDVYVADDVPPAPRRAWEGRLVEDGALVDFSGDGRWWVGLFAGVPGRSWHVWDARTETLVYVGGSLTDPESVVGWHVLTDAGGASVARARMAEDGAAVGCTGARMEVVGLDSVEGVAAVGGVSLRRGAVVDAVDACGGRAVVVDQRGVGRVYGTRTLEEVCRFATVRRGGGGGGAVGCMNWGYVFVSFSGGAIRVWDAMTGEFLYGFRERVGDVGVLAASDRHVAAWGTHSGLHVWDYGVL